MNPNRRIERLYEGLGGKQRAVLVFMHLSEGNAAEAHRVGDAAPWKRYTAPDVEHTEWFEGLRNLTLYFAMEHWRYQAHCNAAQGAMIHFYHVEDADDHLVGDCFDGWREWESRLLSLDAALAAVCAKHGIDPAAVRRLASVDGPFRRLGLGEVSAELVAEMTAAFDKLLLRNR